MNLKNMPVGQLFNFTHDAIELLSKRVRNGEFGDIYKVCWTSHAGVCCENTRTKQTNLLYLSSDYGVVPVVTSL